MEEPPSGVVKSLSVPSEKRPRFTDGGGQVGAMVRAIGNAAGLGRLGVWMREIAPGLAGTHRHFHEVEEEWAFVLAGRGTVRIGPHRVAVESGTFVGFPPGPRPHHFVADRGEPLVILEGGERRPAEDRGRYVDLGRAWGPGPSGLVFRDVDDPPPAEEGDPGQVVVPSAIPPVDLRHDVDPAARRTMHPLHPSAGLARQAVSLASAAQGDRTTALHAHERTDEWAWILSGRALARIGDREVLVGPGDFLGHPAGGPAHRMTAVEPLTYLVGGGIDPDDVVVYPEAGLRRVAGRLEPTAR